MLQVWPTRALATELSPVGKLRADVTYEDGVMVGRMEPLTSSENMIRQGSTGIEGNQTARQAGSLPHCRIIEKNTYELTNVDRVSSRMSSTTELSRPLEVSETVESSDEDETIVKGVDLPPEQTEPQVMVLKCLKSGEVYPVCRQMPRRDAHSGMVSRIDVYFGNVRACACVDTGATNSLLSREIWDQIKERQISGHRDSK